MIDNIMEFTYDKSEYLSLAFTIKKLKDPKNTQPTDYYEVLDQWLKLGVDIYSPTIERDANNILHMHGFLVVKKNFYRKRLQTFGFHVYIRDVFYSDGWERYIKKEEEPLDEKIDNRVYMFDN